MGIYKETFSELNRAALIPFFVIGDPDEETSFELVKTAIDAGADVLELGNSFFGPGGGRSDHSKGGYPRHEGRNDARKGVGVHTDGHDYTSRSQSDCWFITICIYQYGVERFFADFKKAGGTSVLVADLSIDDADEILPGCKRRVWKRFLW